MKNFVKPTERNGSFAGSVYPVRRRQNPAKQALFRKNADFYYLKKKFRGVDFVIFRCLRICRRRTGLTARTTD